MASDAVDLYIFNESRYAKSKKRLQKLVELSAPKSIIQNEIILQKRFRRLWQRSVTAAVDLGGEGGGA